MPSLFGAAFFVGHIYIYKKLGRDKSHPNFIYYPPPVKKWIVEAILKLVADFGCGAYLAYVSNPKSSKMPQ